MTLSNRFYQTLHTFGMNGIEFPVFYSTPIGIRFDIGDSSQINIYSENNTLNPLYIDYCLDRATQIMNALSDPPDILAIQLFYLDETGLKSDINDVLSVIKTPHPHEIDYREKIIDDEICNTAILLWDLSKLHFSKDILLKEIIASDLGGEHLLTSSVFWVWSKDEIMFHLYDDRGADVVASKKASIIDIYTVFNRWILEYDRSKITSIF